LNDFQEIRSAARPGRRTKAITGALNDRGIRPMHDQRWYASSVASLLARAHKSADAPFS
jgi:hypothetical protein